MAYTAARDGALLCTLCPHGCLIREGEVGLCRVRGNKGGDLDLPFRGVLSSAALDPVEKKPLYHFLPGTLSYSIGFWGCNMRCPFCQNYTISQQAEAGGSVSPHEAADAAVRSGAASISYTYSEPAVHPEFCIATAESAREKGLANIAVTNGLLFPKPAKEFFGAMDAANIDLKSFDRDYYRDVLGGDLATVKASIAIAAEITHLELTTLIVPGANDSHAELDALFSFIASVDTSIPLHLSRYFPRYKSEIPATSLRALEEHVEHARRYLSFVYPGNTGNGPVDTVCNECGSLLIRRSGYEVSVLNTSGNVCDECGSTLPYRMQR